MPMSSAGNAFHSGLPLPCQLASGGGSGSPSTTRMTCSTPALRPAEYCPCLKSGIIVSSMMRLAVASVSAPSSP